LIARYWIERGTRWMQPVVLHVALLTGAIVGGCALHEAGAAEPSRKFFDGLCQRGLSELAIDYLDQMRTNAAVPAEFKQTIDYEKGILLISAADAAGDRPERLAAAANCLAAFLRQYPDHALAMTARAQLGRVAIERGRLQAQWAIDPHRTPLQWASGLRQARSLDEEAAPVLAVAEQQYDELQKRLSQIVARGNIRELEPRDEARRELLQIRLAQAALCYQTAESYAAGSPQQREGLAAAAARYHQLYERYRQLLAGCYARLGEARCEQELGDAKQALAASEELFEQPDDAEAFRLMKNKALVLTLETCLLPSVQDWKLALTKGRQWLQSIRPGERSSAEGLAVQYLTGRALLETARTGKADDAARAVVLAESRTLLIAVARSPGVYQQPARALLSDPLWDRNSTSPGTRGHGIN
jgi:hypothetical protein